MIQEAGYHFAVAGPQPESARPDRFALPRIEISSEMDFDAFVEALPEPQPSSLEKRTEFSRLRALRDRSTYFP
jgi:hypothetical protein